MNRRHLLVSLGGALAVIGAPGATTAKAVQNESDRGERPRFVPAGADSGAQRFEGENSAVVEDVGIEGGLTIVDATYSGPEVSTFIVEFVPSDGAFGELFQSELGPYDGERAAVMSSDTYLLDVEADGQWQIGVYEPRATEGAALPRALEGESDRVYGPFEFDGTHIATGSHTGEENYIVTALPMDETGFAELVFNEIGPVDAIETTFRFDGIGWVAVQGSGGWTLELE